MQRDNVEISRTRAKAAICAVAVFFCVCSMSYAAPATQAQSDAALDEFAEDQVLEQKRDAIQFCQGKWPDDYEMQAFCYQKQINARTSVEATRHTILNSGNEGLRTILANCRAKWTKDYEMVAYCINKQATAYAKMRGIK